MNFFAVTIFAHKSFVNCLVKSGCLNNKPPLGDELRKTVQSNLIDKAGEDDVNTLDVQYRCLRRGSSTAENTDIDMSPSLSGSSRMKQVLSKSYPFFSFDSFKLDLTRRPHLLEEWL